MIRSLWFDRKFVDSVWKRELLQAPTSVSDYKVCFKFGAQFLFHVKSKQSVCNTTQLDWNINVSKWNGKFCENVWLTAESIVRIKSYPFLHSWLHDLRSVLDCRKRSSSNHLELKEIYRSGLGYKKRRIKGYGNTGSGIFKRGIQN